MDDAERERLHRFAAEAHALLRRDAIAPLVRQMETYRQGTEALDSEGLPRVLAACQRALRLLEYALADTEPVPYRRREGDHLT